MTEKFSPQFEAEIMRHAPKIDEPIEGQYETFSQEIDPQKTNEELADIVQGFVEKLISAPPGSVMAFEPSNVSRAKQTRDLIVETLQKIDFEQQGIEIVEIGVSKEDADELLAKIQQEPNKKYLIADLRETTLLGFTENEESVEAANKWKRIFNGNENLIGKLWAAHQNEITDLHQEIQDMGIEVAEAALIPSEFKTTPEELALKQVRWMTALKRIGEHYFPNRALYLEGISHNLRSDFTVLALLGEDISLKSINQILGGEFRQPFELSSVKYGEEGVQVQFRDQLKTYSAEEFSQVVSSIREKSDQRKEEWEGLARIDS